MAIRDRDFYFESAFGNLKNEDSAAFIVGRNDIVGTSFVPLSNGALCVHKMPSEATKLRVKAGNVNDSAAGSGARSILLNGIGAGGEQLQEVLITNGTSAGPDSQFEYIRLSTFDVLDSGTYLRPVSANSHAGDITIENAAGTEDWGIIDSTDYPRGVSESGCITAPAGVAIAITDIYYSVDRAKVSDITILERSDILTETAPFASARSVFYLNGLISQGSLQLKAPIFVPSLSDVIILGKIDSGTAAITVGLGLIARFM